MNLKIALPLLIALTVTSCATMDAKECATADWYAIGHEDGSRGYSTDRFGLHRKACSEHGVTAKFPEYKEGYDAGVRGYCTAERGYQLGKANRNFPNVCPSDLVNGVRRGYNIGREVYVEKQSIQREISSIENSIRAIEEGLSVLNGERNEHEKYLEIAEKGLADPAAKDADKLVFYTQREEMRKLIRLKDAEISDLLSEQQAYQDSKNALKNDLQALERKPMPNLN